MSTTHERTLERQMKVLGYLIQRNQRLRLQQFEPMLKTLRESGDWELFPLNRTTIKSTLIGLVKHGLVRTDSVKMGMRYYTHYSPTESGRDTWQTWGG